MKRTILVTCIAVLLASAIAARIGGAAGGGVLAGALAGAAIALTSALAQRKVVERKPEGALNASILGFLAQLGAVLVLTLALRYWPAAQERVDWRSFAIAFASVVTAVVLAGALDNASALRALVRTESRVPEREGSMP